MDLRSPLIPSLRLVALILAGGKSSRMGQDKAILLWDGIPLLDRVTQVATGCCQQVYLITPWPERYQALIGAKAQFLKESPPGQGPLGAFYQGLTQIPLGWDWLFLLACDLPLLDLRIMEGWIRELPLIPREKLAAVPFHNGFWQPLCGFYRPAIEKQIEFNWQLGQYSFQKLLNDHNTYPFPVGDAEGKMLLNCNTPQDFLELRAGS